MRPKNAWVCYFAEFGGPINSSVGPKKMPNTTEMRI